MKSEKWAGRPAQSSERTAAGAARRRCLGLSALASCPRATQTWSPRLGSASSGLGVPAALCCGSRPHSVLCYRSRGDGGMVDVRKSAATKPYQLRLEFVHRWRPRRPASFAAGGERDAAATAARRERWSWRCPCARPATPLAQGATQLAQGDAPVHHHACAGALEIKRSEDAAASACGQRRGGAQRPRAGKLYVPDLNLGHQTPYTLQYFWCPCFEFGTTQGLEPGVPSGRHASGHRAAALKSGSWSLRISRRS
eukprot:SAG31_NODE_125_length_23649_cov_7.156202_18_plen_254_part_00